MEYFNGPEFSNTYSIVAYDEIKKQIGVGMQTHNFAACNRVAWAKPGVGVIATQGYTNPLYAFKGFEMMEHGLALTLPQ